jgi:hypothetical protein
MAIGPIRSAISSTIARIIGLSLSVFHQNSPIEFNHLMQSPSRHISTITEYRIIGLNDGEDQSKGNRTFYAKSIKFVCRLLQIQLSGIHSGDAVFGHSIQRLSAKNYAEMMKAMIP